ncbi:MAG TPA: hypothetical protein VFQ05_06160, partial [Candidatus Eisenbacteria bacterium]|nr:hypothetical protein [Candidatus Eisenbacteria bacterium]
MHPPIINFSWQLTTPQGPGALAEPNTGALVSGPVKEASSVGAERSATAQGTQQSLVAACPPIHLQDVINA